MLKKWFTFELFCIFLTAFLGWHLYSMWFPSTSKLSEESNEMASEAQVLEPLNIIRRVKAEKASYEIIARKNLFNPRRQENWLIKKAVKLKPASPPPPPPPPTPPSPRPKPMFKKRVRKPVMIKKKHTLVLEGIVIFGDRRSALVKDIARPREGVKRVQIGDILDGGKVSSITSAEMVLSEPDGTKTVLTVFDFNPKVRRRHIKTKVVPFRFPRAGLNKARMQRKKINGRKLETPG